MQHQADRRMNNFKDAHTLMSPLLKLQIARKQRQEATCYRKRRMTKLEKRQVASCLYLLTSGEYVVFCITLLLFYPADRSPFNHVGFVLPDMG
jgi:hypothetical protein